MSIHDDARAAFESVYDAEIARYRNLLAIADTELVQLRTDKATYVAEVERLSQEIVSLEERIAELESNQTPKGWTLLHDVRFDKNDGWELRQETQSNDNSYNSARNAVFGNPDGLHLIGRRETEGKRPYTSADILGKHLRTPNYFRAEVTGTAPTEYGMWPCLLWFRPLTHGDSGEIDVMETWPFDWNGTPRLYSTVWENYTTKRKENARLDYSKLPNPDPSAVHTYVVEKVRDRISFFVDGVTVYSWEKSKMNPTMRSWYDSVYEILEREWYPRITLQIGGPNAKEPKPEWRESKITVQRLRIFKEA